MLSILIRLAQTKLFRFPLSAGKFFYGERPQGFARITGGWD